MILIWIIVLIQNDQWIKFNKSQLTIGYWLWNILFPGIGEFVCGVQSDSKLMIFTGAVLVMVTYFTVYISWFFTVFFAFIDLAVYKMKMCANTAPIIKAVPQGCNIMSSGSFTGVTILNIFFPGVGSFLIGIKTGNPADKLAGFLIAICWIFSWIEFIVLIPSGVGSILGVITYFGCLLLALCHTHYTKKWCSEREALGMNNRTAGTQKIAVVTTLVTN